MPPILTLFSTWVSDTHWVTDTHGKELPLERDPGAEGKKFSSWGRILGRMDLTSGAVVSPQLCSDRAWFSTTTLSPGNEGMPTPWAPQRAQWRWQETLVMIWINFVHNHVWQLETVSSWSFVLNFCPLLRISDCPYQGNLESRYLIALEVVGGHHLWSAGQPVWVSFFFYWVTSSYFINILVISWHLRLGDEQHNRDLCIFSLWSGNSSWDFTKGLSVSILTLQMCYM